MAYATAADVKKYATSVSAAATGLDALIAELLVSETAFIDNYINVPIVQGDYQERYDGEGGTLIAPRCFPITAVRSVSIDGVAMAPWSGKSANQGFAFSKRFVQAYGGAVFPQGRSNIFIDYTAGFAAIPADIKQACVELVAYRIEERKRMGQTSKTLNGETITFDSKIPAPAVVVARLFSYRSFVTSAGM